HRLEEAALEAAPGPRQGPAPLLVGVRLVLPAAHRILSTPRPPGAPKKHSRGHHHIMDRTAPADHPVHGAVARRDSPRAFTDEAVTPDQVLSLLEAARWAASCSNEQPWRFIVAMRGPDDTPNDSFEKLLGCLAEGNRVWA